MEAFAIEYPGRGVEAWHKVERPELRPGPGQVLVRVRAVSLNYRDLAIALGFYGGPIKPGLVPLADGAGEIVALGQGVTDWQIGERVCSTYYQTWENGPVREEYLAHQLGALSSDGVLAQYALLSERSVVRVPQHLSYEEAATLPCAALTAWTALFETSHPLQPGATVLIQGTGGVSLFALQFARAAGHSVIAITSSAAKAERLRSLGAAHVINYREQPDWHTEVLKLTGGVGVDHIIEVGGPGTLERSFQATRYGGTISLIGLLSSPENKIQALPVLLRAIHVDGVSVGSRRSFEAMNRALETLAIKPIVDEIFPFDEAPKALAKLQAATHFGKIVVRVA